MSRGSPLPAAQAYRLTPSRSRSEAADRGSPPVILPQFRRAERLVRWFIPLGAFLAFLGYWGPWIAHPTAGMTVSGIDLGEFVKFLPALRNQELAVRREFFYLPAVAISLLLSLTAFRAEFRFAPLTRLALILGALTATTWLLPPAWSPTVLLTPEFRLQTASLAFCLLVALLSPFLALLPPLAARSVVSALALLAIALPCWHFYLIWPAVAAIYAAPLQLGWGPLLLAPGLALALAGWWLQPASHSITHRS